VIVVLVAVNIAGVREAARLNVSLAVIDFATQLLLVLLGFALVLSPSTLAGNVDWGVTPTWSQFALAIPVGMIAYTGIETVSNLAEEARDPAKNVPAAYLMTAIAVFAIFFTLPAVSLSALPVETVDGERVTLLALPPEEGGYQNDPVLGVVEHMGLSGAVLDVLKIYVGVLAATILFIATNAGVIGASRITYAMSSYRQLPEIFRRVHPRLKTPWIALVVFAGVAPILTLLPGKVDFLGTMYSFGAMLSFTVAHVSIVVLRYRQRDAELVFRGRPNLRLGGVDWPLFAIVGGLGTGLAWLVVVVQTADTRYAGLAWLAIGFAMYLVYRRRVVRRPLAETVRAPAQILGPALEVEFRTIVVPVTRSAESEEALVAAVRLAARRGARVALVHVVEVPLDKPLDAKLPEAEAAAEAILDDAQALAESYGIRVVTRLVRDRSAARAIVREAEQRTAELIVLGAPRRGTKALFGKTTDHVLKSAPCRVLLAAGKAAA
jgi:basic amino acid/polyamine antiporter, APA family